MRIRPRFVRGLLWGLGVLAGFGGCSSSQNGPAADRSAELQVVGSVDSVGVPQTGDGVTSTGAGAAAVLGSGGDSLAPESVEVDAPRALWVVRHDLADADRLARALEWAAASGFTDIFLQLRGRGDAYYRSALVPRAEELAGERDPLAEALEAARGNGLRIHAWINLGIAWSAPRWPKSSEHLVLRHPEWFVSIARGRKPRSTLEFTRRELDGLEIEGHFLAVANPEVVAHLEAVAQELVTGYAVDGLHLDYARLPRGVKSYDPVTCEAFQSEFGIDPLFLLDRRAARVRLGAEEFERLQAEWQGWNEERVTELVRRVAAAARAARPGILVSAAVYPDPVQAGLERAQAWDRWLAQGLIDVAVPMCYAADVEVARRDLRTARRVGVGRLWAGLGLYNKPLEQALAGADEAREIGYEGVALFSYGAARAAGVGAGPTIARAMAAFAASAVVPGAVGR